MTFPHYFHVFGYRLHPHPVMEMIAYALAFRLYLHLRKRWPGPRPAGEQAVWVLAGAVIGALAGSKLLALIESIDQYSHYWGHPEIFLGGKTIVGGLLGGWIGVEIAKRIMRIRISTGDACVFPLIVGMSIGRIGCFLTGLSDHTCGTHTSVPWAVNFGDGPRHPTQLYDIVFLLILGTALLLRLRRPLPPGHLFRVFLFSYLAYRFCVEFLKDLYTPYLGLSAIQVACLCGCAVLLLGYVRRRNQPAAMNLSPV